MKIACILGRLSLALRGSMDFRRLRDDPRGLTGTELAATRIAETLAELGHDVSFYTLSNDTQWNAVAVRPLEHLAEVDERFDAAISFNEPDLLREVHGPRLRVCEHYLNDVWYCKVDFEQFVDLWVSPSRPHLQKMLTDEDLRDVEVTQYGPRARYTPDPSKWTVIPLGCDPDRYVAMEKVPGRVVYCSSPDRGLHWLLQAWPKIVRAVPHASLKVFYRLRPWLDEFTSEPFSSRLEKTRGRALYISQVLPRLAPFGVRLCDSVSREVIEREMALAEVLAYPCDTVRWSEGFSCSVLEGCAARACPVITPVDALGEIYGSVLPMAQPSSEEWSDLVIRALKDADFRQGVNARAAAFAGELTWKTHALRLEQAIQARLSSN